MTTRTSTGTTASPSTWTDPTAREDLKNLVRLASVSEHPDETQQAALAATRRYLIDAFTAVGMPDVREVSIRQPEDTAEPNMLVHGTWTVDPAAPTVLLYGHYDVVRADDAPWHGPGGDMDPFEPREFDGRLYGRGAADDKSGLVMHLSALRAFRSLGRRPPVNLILAVEGEEEIGTGSLDRYVEANPGLFQADVIVVADTGNVALGRPTLTTSLRGLAAADVTVSTLDHAVHSGMFGGPAPDAFMVLVRILDSLTDWRGDCAVAGLTRYTPATGGWPASGPEEERTFREQCGVLDGVRLTGSGSITQRVAGAPAINVVGLDGLAGTAQSVTRLHHTVTARISVRIAPDQDPDEAYEALRTHLLAVAPYGVTPQVENPFAPANGFHLPGEGGTYLAAASRAAGDAYGLDCVQSGLGGSIPTINVIAGVQEKPGATVVMWGCEEPLCRIHSAPESVSYEELTLMTRAEVNLLNYVAGSHGAPFNADAG